MSKAYINTISFGFTARLTALISFIVLLSITSVAYFTYQEAEQQLVDGISAELKSIVLSTSPLIDGDALENIYHDPETGLEGQETFARVQAQLMSVRDSNLMPHGVGLSPLYILRKSWQFNENNTLEFVVMTNKNKENRFFVGALYSIRKFQVDALNGVLGVTDIYYDDEGAWLTVAAPIYSSEKSVIAILQADRRVDFIEEKIHSLRVIYLATGLTSLLVAIILSFIFARQTTKPIKNLANALRKVRHDKSELGQHVLVEGSAELRELAEDFNSMTSELGDLYASLNEMAYMDSLTSLPNRALFQDRIEQLTQLSRRENQSFCIMMMDLDRFKNVNDTRGHEYGDKLLKLVGERLQALLRSSDSISLTQNDTVARLGGDEFATLLPTARSLESATIVAKKISEAMKEIFTIDGHTFDISISIGICIFPQDGADVTTLLRNADIAMYEAKKLQIGFKMFNKELGEKVLEQITLAAELREAIQQKSLKLFYQPKIDFKSGKICGVEALSRWIHPELGFISPDKFIMIAEKTGLIHPLTVWVLDTALAQSVHWRELGYSFDIAVNLSAHSLRDSSIVNIITDALNKWQVSPSMLSLEVTESGVMSDPQQAIEVLTELRDMGIKLSIDDFGTGYSSLSYLKQLPVHEIKIDRSFVTDMLTSTNDKVIVQSTIDLAHNMNLKVIAEGIEDEATYLQLEKMGCDIGQGYFMARPLNAADLNDWLIQSDWGLQQTVSSK